MHSTPWPYPFWIAHRGAGKLAPENTLAAFRLGAAHGFCMAECDAKLSADGVVYLLHDDDLARTTNAQDPSPQQDWAALSQLDAGAWHSPGYAGESLLRLAQLAAWCRANGHHLNIEIKPVPGTEEPTGTAVAHAAAALWRGAVSAPLLSSFAPEALAAAQKAQPQLPRALLLDAWRSDALALAAQLGAVALVCNYTIWTLARVQQAQQAGLRALSYTVNDDAAAQQLQAWGTDGIITDRVDHFDPRTPRP